MSTQEEITIAKMVLSGWRFEPIGTGSGRTVYGIFSPSGDYCGSRGTRYTAALAAEREMEIYNIGLPR